MAQSDYDADRAELFMKAEAALEEINKALLGLGYWGTVLSAEIYYTNMVGREIPQFKLDVQAEDLEPTRHP